MKKIAYWLQFLFIFLIPISQFFSVRLLFLLVIYSVFVYREKILYFFFRQSWDLLLFLVVLLLGLMYTEDKVQGIKELETNFSMFGIGFLFYGTQFNTTNVFKHSLYSFSFGVITASIIILINAIIQYSILQNISVFQYNKLTDILGLQPTYFAFYVIFSITYFVYTVYYDLYSNISRLFLTVAIVFLFIILLLTSGKTAFISLIFIFSFFMLKYLLDPKNSIKTFVIVIVSILMLTFLFFNNYYTAISNLSMTDYWERSVLWEAAINANESSFFGVGTGDYKIILNKYYESQGLNRFAAESFNSHNQFIQLYFSNGIFGLVAILIVIGRPLFLSFKSQNSLGILILFPFVLYGMTEVFLGRYQGVVFFALCHQIVTFQCFMTKDHLKQEAT